MLQEVRMLATVLTGRILLIGALGIALWAPAGASGDDRKTDGKEREPVITEADLVDRYGAPAPTPAPAGARTVRTEAAPAEGDGETIGKSLQKAMKVERRKAEIDGSIERLRKRIASLRNPFLPRIRETEREKEQEKGMDSAARIGLLERRIAALEKERESLETETKALPATGR